MIVGVGLDILEVSRMERALSRHGEGFEERVFTESERAYCSGQAFPARAYAVRFAAKEATLKALGTGWSQGLGFQQVEIVRAKNGQPSLKLSGPAAIYAEQRGVRALHVSLTHQAATAAAVVVLEG
jgi:holo-[acyl-carrier protein] synthase